MSVLTETKYEVEKVQRWLTEAKTALKKVLKLPQEIQDMNGLVSIGAGDDPDVSIYFYGNEYVDKLWPYFDIGTPEINSLDGTFQRQGTATNELGLSKVTIVIRNLPAPEGCEVTKEEGKVTRFVSKCPEII